MYRIVTWWSGDNMKIKMPKLSKSERILALLAYWDPLKMKDDKRYYMMFYNYEAEEIAQSVRKNSSLAAVEKKVRAVIEMKAELEDVDVVLDEAELHQVAAGILHSVKNG